jgi:hypothetical protein
LAALAADRVDFAVVGGLAVIFNGYPRLTLDVDILVHVAPENLRKLLDCLAGWGEGWARELKPEDFVSQEGAIRVIEEFDLDIFTRMSGKSLEDFRPRLRYLETGGVRIFCPPTSFFSNRIPGATRTSWTCRPCGKSSRAKAIDRRQPVALQNKILRSFAPLWLIFPPHEVVPNINSDPPRSSG